MKQIIIESTDRNDSPADIEEKLEKAMNSMVIQREKKEFDDNYLKDKRQAADKLVAVIFGNMIKEIQEVL